jgi:hypothetical protein
MRLHADCEYKFGDISVWNGTDPDALALYEVKVLYSDMSEASIQGVIDKGHRQLGGRAKMEANRKIGLFFSIYYAQGPSASHSQRRDTFEARVRNAVRTRFTSDHHIRMTELSHLAEIDYGSAGKPDPWHTMSWVTWGIPKE